MEVYKLVIESVLPDLNTEINNCKKSWKMYAKTKAKTTSSIQWQCLSQLKGVKITKPVALVFVWYMANKRKDPDNVYFAQKYILDGLVKAQVLEGDGFKHTSGGTMHVPKIDKERPRVEIFVFPGEFVFSNNIVTFVNNVS